MLPTAILYVFPRWSAIHVRVTDLCTVKFLTEINEFSTISESFIKKRLLLFELNY